MLDVYEAMSTLRAVRRLKPDPIPEESMQRVLQAAAPTANWRDHKRLVMHLQRQAGQGDRSRKAGRVLDSGVLLRAGIALATPQAEAATTPLEGLKRNREGALVAVLSVVPLLWRGVPGRGVGG